MSDDVLDRLFSFLSQYISLDIKEIEVLTKLDLIRKYEKGESILRMGEMTQESYFLLQGLVRSYYLIKGEEHITEFYEELAGWTPQCAVNGKASDYFIDCLEPSFVLVSTPDISEDFFKEHPKFEKLCRILSDKWMADQNRSFDNYKNSSPEDRYRQLVEMKPGLVQRVPQYQLASYLGIKPESLSRIRKRISEGRS